MKNGVPSEITNEPTESISETKSEDVFNVHLKSLMNDLDKCSDTESKLQCVISFMESSLAQEGSPHFKSFWDSRTLCIALFKEPIPAQVRASLWEKYSALSKEARRLKELLNEQSAFAEEQIEIAIKALETDIAKIENLESAPAQTFQSTSSYLKNKIGHYHQLQHQLNFLNAGASRITALRKELIKTEMRARKKNKFFQELSSAGDRIFPKRKELIKTLSDLFVSDIDLFVKEYFENNSFTESLYDLREEIKVLQNLAKELTLNAHAFNHTRLRLSECWDKLKEADKARKHQRLEQKKLHHQNLQAVQEKIKDLSQQIQDGKVNHSNADPLFNDIQSFMKKVELGREEVQQLREELKIARKPILEQMAKEEEAKQNYEKERNRQKQQKLTELQAEITNLMDSAEAQTLETLIANRDALTEKINASGLSKLEKQELERQFKGLRNVIADKKEHNLTSLSSLDRQNLQQLQDTLQKSLEHRNEVKENVDQLRKACGTSGLDFEKAMDFQSQLFEEKARLEKINLAIEELEDKIASFEM